MTAPTQPPTVDDEPREERSRGYIDEIAYVAPMALFLAFIWVGTTWKSAYAGAYVARTALVAALLVYFWRYYTKISWRFWWLGIIVGVIGIVQWVAMQLWLQNHFDRFKPDPDVYNPFDRLPSPTLAWAFIGVRVFGAMIVVPIMEELFWRDYLWRQILSP